MFLTCICFLSSLMQALSWAVFSRWDASARTLTVVSASWSHFRKLSRSLCEACTVFSSVSKKFCLSTALKTRQVSDYSPITYSITYIIMKLLKGNLKVISIKKLYICHSLFYHYLYHFFSGYYIYSYPQMFWTGYICHSPF